ncbi:MAG: hypothetical protein HYU39_00660 [Thaumarchaeota archaeon]|nr:hypothetical protein [Nitrososphaerota archaeon]
MDEFEADLSVDFAGIKLKNPLIAEAAGYTVHDWGMKRLIKGGCGAIITKSTTWDPLGGYPRQWEATPQPRCYWVYNDGKVTYDGTEALQNPGHKKMSEFIRNVKPLADQHNCHIIGSLSGRSPQEAAYIAQEFEKAGASAIHMDLVCTSAGPFRSIQYPGRGYERLGQYWSMDLERLREVIRATAEAVDIPVIPKTVVAKWLPTPEAITDYSTPAKGIAYVGGAPTLDIDPFTAKQVYSKISGSSLKYLTNRVTVDLVRLKTGKALLPSGGIDSALDVVKLIMLGADAAGICTVLYKDANAPLQICRDLEYFMIDQALDSLSAIKGVALKNLPEKGWPPIRAAVTEQAKALAEKYQGFMVGENPPFEEALKSKGPEY